ncbi:MAG: RidA family protein [Mycetocola sp.]
MRADQDAATPRAQGNYRTAIVSGGYVLTAGVTPRRDGVLIATGTIGAEIDTETARDLVALATASAIMGARTALADALPANRLVRCVRTVVLLRATPDFTEHARVADAASATLAAEFGADGLGARTAFGAASLPGGAPCEVELTFEHAPPPGTLP